MNILVGYTGFVGSNIYQYGKFDKVFNSKNIEEAYGLEPDLLIYAGLRAEKYLANNEPEKDMELIKIAERNIEKINPRKLVLISTIDVMNKTNLCDEDTKLEKTGLSAYGLNRLILEEWVREKYPTALIIRLPALFGINIKKNFIYDYMNFIPYMIKESKMKELIKVSPKMMNYYTLADNGFYRCKELSGEEKNYLKGILKELGFSALSFTDSRSRYQFYPLSRLWNDINIALDNHLLLWHPATEPISAGELYRYLTGNEFINEIQSEPADYNFITRYANLFGKEGTYILNRDEIMSEILEFVKE